MSPGLEHAPGLPQDLPRLHQKLHRIGNEDRIERISFEGRREGRIGIEILNQAFSQIRVGVHFLLVHTDADEAGGGKDGGREVGMGGGTDFEDSGGGREKAQIVLSQGTSGFLVIDGGEVGGAVEWDAVFLFAGEVVGVVGPGFGPFPGGGGDLGRAGEEGREERREGG